MAYMTDRKRAQGLGSAGTGTEHHWKMTISSAALCILVPLFVFTFGHALGMPYQEAAAYYARPFPAIVAALTLLVGMHHFRGGAQVAIEDYVGGFARKASIVVTVCLAYGLAAIGLFAVIRLAV